MHNCCAPKKKKKDPAHTHTRRNTHTKIRKLAARARALIRARLLNGSDLAEPVCEQRMSCLRYAATANALKCTLHSPLRVARALMAPTRRLHSPKRSFSWRAPGQQQQQHQQPQQPKHTDARARACVSVKGHPALSYTHSLSLSLSPSSTQMED